MKEATSRKLSRKLSLLFVAPLLVTALLHAALLGIYVWAFGGDLSALVCADAKKIGRWPYEHMQVGFPGGGFDGQFFYVLARDPWHRYDASIIDLPAYRHARILYPGLAWALSGGDPVRLFWILPAINLAAVVGLTWLGARLATHFGRSAWWGVLLPLVLNAGMPALRNLTDPLAAATVCGVLVAWILRWPAWQLGAWAVAAVLSREQNILILLIVLFETLRARSRIRAVILLAALLLWVGWVITLRVMYGAWPLAPGNISPPFAGMWYRWTHLEGLSGAASRIIHVAGMLLLCFQVGLSVALVYFRADRLLVFVGLVGATLAVLGGTGIYLNGWSYSRVFLWMPLAIWLWSLESGRRWPALLLTSATIWPIAAVAQVWRG